MSNDYNKDLEIGAITPYDFGFLTKMEIPPKGGWELDSYYIVAVAFTVHNPIHNRIMYTGLIKDGETDFFILPCIFNPPFPPNNISDWYYVKGINKIDLNDNDVVQIED